MLKSSFAALVALVPTVLAAQTGTALAAVDFNTAPLTRGTWSYHSMPGGSAARFVDTTGTARLAIECNRATRRVTIARTTSIAAPSILVWTSVASRTLPARFEPNARRVSAEIAASDALLDAIAFSRGRIAVTMEGVELLVMPAWPEPARTIEDCRI